MSDIAVVEITTPVESDSAPKSKVKNTAKANTQASEGKANGKWARTRFCFCPDNAATDCRFHSRSEPGWETCPWEKRPGRGLGRWLWSSISGVPTTSDSELSVGANIKELSKTQQRAGDRYLH